MNILDLQRQLKAQGFDPGPEDGIWGRRTLAAVKAFQAAKGLGIDGIVGPQTIAALGLVATPTAPPWYAEALRKVGLHETSDNVALRRYLKSDGATLGDPSKLPWCGDFVETSLKLGIPGIKVPANPYWALNWSTWGVPVNPQYGAILSFERNGGGHVGFYAGETPTHYLVLGGNQSNKVSKALVSKSQLRGSRMPPGYTGTGVKLAAEDGKGLSSDQMG
jgi:uncharacterized protein (TIGR02594 family)